MITYKRIIEIHFNWYATPENGEEVTIVMFGAMFRGKQVIEITEHLPAGEGDRLWYDLIFHGRKGSVRIFNPNLVVYDEGYK